MSDTVYIFGAVPGDNIDHLDAGDSPVLFCDGGIGYAECVSGGKRYLFGDFDSLSVKNASGKTAFESMGLLFKETEALNNGDIVKISGTDYEIIKFPVRKDASDLELAMEYAWKSGAKKVVIYGCLGGDRPDHGFVNLLMISAYAEKGLKIIMTNGRETYAAFKESGVSLKPTDGHVGVLAVLSPAELVSISGLSYEAEGITLLPGSTYGTSNYFEADAKHPAVIKAGKGSLVVCGDFGPDKIDFC